MECRPTFAQIRSNSAEIGQFGPHVSQFGTNRAPSMLGRSRPNSDQCCLESATSDTSSTKCGQTWPEFDLIWSDIGQIRQLAQHRPKLADRVDQSWPDFDRVRPTSGSESTDIGPTSPHPELARARSLQSSRFSNTDPTSDSNVRGVQRLWSFPNARQVIPNAWANTPRAAGAFDQHGADSANAARMLTSDLRCASEAITLCMQRTPALSTTRPSAMLGRYSESSALHGGVAAGRPRTKS